MPVRGDTIDENNETFNLNLSSASGASIADSRGVGTIRDDDGAPRMTVDDARVREGNRGLTRMAFVVRLSQISGKTITVKYATQRRSAIPGSDYQSASGTLTIPAGSATGVVVVNIIGDTRAEADENFNLNLSSARNASLRDSTRGGHDRQRRHPTPPHELPPLAEDVPRRRARRKRGPRARSGRPCASGSRRRPR